LPGRLTTKEEKENIMHEGLEYAIWLAVAIALVWLWMRSRAGRR
jgi:hypothetical protein